jgi:hypothetical protein
MPRSKRVAPRDATEALSISRRKASCHFSNDRGWPRKPRQSAATPADTPSGQSFGQLISAFGSPTLRNSISKPSRWSFGNTSPDKIRDRLKLNGATPEEIDFLLEGQRVELNAMTSDQFVAFVERKLTEAGIAKVVPPKDQLEEVYRLFARSKQIEEIVEKEIAALIDAEIAIHEDLEARVRPKDRSLSVIPSVIDPDGFIVHSHAGDDWRQCRQHVRARLSLSAFRPRRELKRRIRNPADDGAEHKRELALRIWREAVNPRETLVEAYLKSRGLDLPDEAANEAIRFHPHCPFGGERLPAMIALVRNIRTDESQAIQRTALTPDGREVRREGKTFRMTLGTSLEGAIKMIPMKM